MNAQLAMFVCFGALNVGQPAPNGLPSYNTPPASNYARPYVTAPPTGNVQNAVAAPPPARVVPHVSSVPPVSAVPSVNAVPSVTNVPPTSAIPMMSDAPSGVDFGEPMGGFGADGTDFELDSDVLIWWTRSLPLPALVTTSSQTDLGILGNPTTRVVLGQEDAKFDTRVGGRFTGRFYIDEGWGLMLSGFWLENGARRNLVNEWPVLAVPIVNPISGAETAIRLAGIGVAGAAELELGQRFWNMDVATICRVDDSLEWQLDFFAGFRFLQLAESLVMRSTSVVTPASFFNGNVALPGSTFQGLDSFTTRNSFYGGNVGARVLCEICPGLVFKTQAQIALGSTNQTVGINGATAYLAPNHPAEFAIGSTLVQRTNFGKYVGDQFTVIPQINCTFGYRLCEQFMVTIGYDFVYWSSVARPGDQIDRVVNPNLPPIQNTGVTGGPNRPFPRIERTDFWAQGISAGLHVSF